MPLKSGLDVHVGQRLALTPGMKYGMTVLQLSTVDLIEWIRRETAENPLLEVTEPRSHVFSPDIHERNASRPESLSESLRKQLTLMPLDTTTAALAQFLTGDLTDDGYLSESATEMMTDLGVTKDQAEAAIRALQACEPAGVAARNLPECLELQLIDKGIDSELARGATQNLEALMEGRWRKLSRILGITRDALESLATLIRNLPPFPAAQYCEPAQILIPEVLVEPDGQGGLLALPATDILPQIAIDRALAAQANEGALQQLHARAENLVRAIGFRHKTLSEVTRAVLSHQSAFFEQGPEQMKPLTRAEVAKELGLHASTVGRAIQGKALLYKGLAHPLSQFFTAALGDNSTGGVSAYRAQQLIKRIVDAEPADSPRSDEEIATTLRREGVDIARRTVAKYRGCMNIPSSFERKRHKTARASGSAKYGLGSSKFL